MKKRIFNLIFIFSALFLLPLSANAETYGDLTYSVSNGVVTITDCNEGAVSVEIPSEINDLPVTVIGYRAFYNCTALTSVTIPDSVTNINQYAFWECVSLKEIVIPDSVTIIQQYAFYGCTQLKKVTMSNSITTINSGVFDGCASLEAITIPNSVTSIKEYAFNECTSLKSITIPNSVTSIGNYVFMDCTALTEIKIPDSVTSIGGFAFDHTGYYNDNTNWENDVLYIGNHLIKAKNSLTGGYSVKDGTVCIAGYAFLNCKDMTSITIPDSVKGIGQYSFCNCTGLTEISIPNTVKTIDAYAFKGCTSLKKATIGGGSIVDNAFAGCTALESVTLGENVTSIGNAFTDTPIYNNPDNRENGILYIDKCLIKADASLSGDYAIKDGTRMIAVSAFSGCTGLTGVEIPDSVTMMSGSAFKECSNLTQVTIGKGLTEIPYAAFQGCTAIEQIVIPDNIYNIGSQAFYGCKGLIHVTIGSKVLNIDSRAFSGCTSLNEIAIPDNVKTIGASAFSGCSALRNITIGKGLESVGMYTFSSCSNLTAVYISDLSAWCGIAFAENSSTPFCNYNENVKNLYVNGKPVTELVIPDDVTAIGNYAFYGITGLTSVKLSNTVESIGYYSFAGCNAITEITIPENVKSIGASAFYGCTALAEINLHENITSISGGAFNSTAYYNDDTNWESHALYIDGYLLKLRNSDGAYIIKDGTKVIAGGALSYTDLVAVEIPASVKIIGVGAFYGSTSLQYVEYGGSEADWKTISIDYENNEVLLNAQINYNSKLTATITYDANGGTNAPQSQAKLKYSAYEITNEIPEKSGYTFIGWATVADAIAAKYQPNDIIDLESDITLYAVWRKPITLQTEVNGGRIGVKFSDAPLESMVIMVWYKDMKTVDIQSAICGASDMSFYTDKEYDEAKIMIWSGFDSMVPLYSAVSVDL